MDIGIPIVFPDYLIAVNTPEVRVPVPDLPFIDIPGVPDQITIPSTNNKVPELGHAGVLFVKGATGLTKYYEYGRYAPAGAKGLTRKVGVKDAQVRNGEVTFESLRVVLAQIAAKSGQSGRIMGAYITVESGFDGMLKYAQERIDLNKDASREEYALLSNSCLHFMKETLEAGGIDMPVVIDPRPAGYIERVRSNFPDLDVTTGGRQLTIEGLGSWK